MVETVIAETVVNGKTVKLIELAYINMTVLELNIEGFNASYTRTLGESNLGMNGQAWRQDIVEMNEWLESLEHHNDAREMAKKLIRTLHESVNTLAF